MEPAKHWLGRLLSLVGITNPEDAARKKSAVPQWKSADVAKKTGEKAPERK
jgi:hypothetical protein